MVDLSGKVAIVTGGGRGIGKAIAHRLAGNGATAVIATRTAGRGESVVREIENVGGKASLFALDVTDRDSVRRLIEYTGERHGGIDIIVHAAATIPFGFIESLEEDDFDVCMKSVLYAAYWVTQFAVPYLAAAHARGGGRMVFISSTNGPQYVLPGLTHYGAAKNGLEAFVRGAAVELGNKGITVNAINPGLIASDNMKEKLTEEQASAMAGTFPVNRVGLPEDIAEAVMYLVSPAGSYVTGHSLVVDGGAALIRPGSVSSALDGK